MGRFEALWVNRTQRVLQQVYRFRTSRASTELTDLVSTPAETLSEGEMELHDPSEIDYSKVKLGIHSGSTNPLPRIV